MPRWGYSKKFLPARPRYISVNLFLHNDDFHIDFVNQIFFSDERKNHNYLPRKPHPKNEAIVDPYIVLFNLYVRQESRYYIHFELLTIFAKRSTAFAIIRADIYG